MVTYIGIYTYSSLIAIFENIKGNKKMQNILTIMLICILALISGTRYYLGGTDYYVYNNVFSSIPTIPDFFRNFSDLDDLYNIWNGRWIFILKFTDKDIRI